MAEIVCFNRKHCSLDQKKRMQAHGGDHIDIYILVGLDGSIYIYMYTHIYICIHTCLFIDRSIDRYIYMLHGLGSCVASDPPSCAVARATFRVARLPTKCESYQRYICAIRSSHRHSVLGYTSCPAHPGTQLKGFQ